MGRGTFSSMERRFPGLKTETLPSPDRPNGKHELTATEAAFPGVTKYEITAQAGQTYFFVARTSKRKNAMIAAAGATGGGILGLPPSTGQTSAMTIPARSISFRWTRRPRE